MWQRNSKSKQIWNNILQLWFGGYMAIVTNERRNQISPTNHLVKLLTILKDFMGAFARLFIPNKLLPENKIWFFSISSNNFLALKDVQRRTNNSVMVSNHSFSSTRLENHAYLNLRYRFFHSFLFPFKLMHYSFWFPNRALNFYDMLFKVNGVYSECLRILKLKKPKAIIFSNDHEIIPRALLLAANEMDIPTYYIQHASISRYFPPLEFKYALLEGEDSRSKYLKIGPTNTKIFEIGIPKFDKYYKSINKNKTIKNIGIAYNMMDDLTLVYELLKVVKSSFPELKIIVRPHPSDDRLFNPPGVGHSDSKKENAFEFLSGIDVLVAADSSIHLEAVILNVYSIGFNFSQKYFIDYYEYHRNGLIDYCQNTKELTELISSIIHNKPDVQHRAKYFNAAIDSDFYGLSSIKASTIIMETLSQNE